MATRTSPIIIVAAALFVVGTAAALLTRQQTEPATSKPVSSATSSSELDVKVKNIIIQSNSTSGTTSSKPNAQDFELNGNLHAGLTSPTSNPSDSTPPSDSSFSGQNKKQTASVIPVQSIDTESNIKIAAGESYGINIQVKPLNASYKDVTWSTSDNQIAKVDKTGMVTGVSTGNCIITVSTADGKATAMITVTVCKASDELEVYNDRFK